MQPHTCTYCERRFDCSYNGRRLKRTRDHVQPKSLGGRTDERNIVICCNECNTVKGDMTLDELGLKMQYFLNRNHGSVTYRGVILTRVMMQTISENAIKLK